MKSPLKEEMKPSHDYDDIRNLSKVNMKKEDKNELLSQYFSAKRSMKM